MTHPSSFSAPIPQPISVKQNAIVTTGGQVTAMSYTKGEKGKGKAVAFAKQMDNNNGASRPAGIFTQPNGNPIKFWLSDGLEEQLANRLKRHIEEHGGIVRKKVPREGFVLVDPANSHGPLRIYQTHEPFSFPRRFTVHYHFVLEATNLAIEGPISLDRMDAMVMEWSWPLVPPTDADATKPTTSVNEALTRSKGLWKGCRNEGESNGDLLPRALTRQNVFGYYGDNGEPGNLTPQQKLFEIPKRICIHSTIRGKERRKLIKLVQENHGFTAITPFEANFVIFPSVSALRMPSSSKGAHERQEDDLFEIESDVPRLTADGIHCKTVKWLQTCIQEGRWEEVVKTWGADWEDIDVDDRLGQSITAHGLSLSNGSQAISKNIPEISVKSSPKEPNLYPTRPPRDDLNHIIDRITAQLNGKRKRTEEDSGESESETRFTIPLKNNNNEKMRVTQEHDNPSPSKKARFDQAEKENPGRTPVLKPWENGWTKQPDRLRLIPQKQAPAASKDLAESNNGRKPKYRIISLSESQSQSQSQPYSLLSTAENQYHDSVVPTQRPPRTNNIDLAPANTFTSISTATSGSRVVQYPPERKREGALKVLAQVGNHKVKKPPPPNPWRGNHIGESGFERESDEDSNPEDDKDISSTQNENNNPAKESRSTQREFPPRKRSNLSLRAQEDVVPPTLEDSTGISASLSQSQPQPQPQSQSQPIPKPPINQVTQLDDDDAEADVILQKFAMQTEKPSLVPIGDEQGCGLAIEDANRSPSISPSRNSKQSKPSTGNSELNVAGHVSAQRQETRDLVQFKARMSDCIEELFEHDDKETLDTLEGIMERTEGRVERKEDQPATPTEQSPQVEVTGATMADGNKGKNGEATSEGELVQGLLLNATPYLPSKGSPPKPRILVKDSQEVNQEGIPVPEVETVNILDPVVEKDEEAEKQEKDDVLNPLPDPKTRRRGVRRGTSVESAALPPQTRTRQARRSASVVSETGRREQPLRTTRARSQTPLPPSVKATPASGRTRSRK